MSNTTAPNTTPQTICLTFYIHENRQHHHTLLYEWLLEQAKKNGIQGGSAFRAIAGFGRHGQLQEDHFFELDGNLTIQVMFFVQEVEAALLLDLVERENIVLFYTRTPVDSGYTSLGH